MDDLTRQELQLIELLRHQDALHSTVEMSTDLGRWHIRLADHDAGVSGDGRGDAFGSAWDDIVDPRLRGPHLRLIK